MCEYQCGLIDLRNHIGYGEGLTGTGRPQQNLLFLSFLNAVHQLLNCLWLISLRLIIRYKIK